MSAQVNPRNILVHSERDLAALIPGDLVKVGVGDKPEWMVYGGIRDGRDTFLKKLPREVVKVYRSERGFLQFPGDYVRFDSLHRDSTLVESSSPSYGDLKVLADRLD